MDDNDLCVDEEEERMNVNVPPTINESISMKECTVALTDLQEPSRLKSSFTVSNSASHGDRFNSNQMQYCDSFYTIIDVV